MLAVMLKSLGYPLSIFLLPSNHPKASNMRQNCTGLFAPGEKYKTSKHTHQNLLLPVSTLFPEAGEACAGVVYASVARRRGVGRKGLLGNEGGARWERLWNEAGRPQCQFVADQKINEKCPHQKTLPKHRSSPTERPRSNFGSILGFVLAYIQHIFVTNSSTAGFGKNHTAPTRE